MLKLLGPIFLLFTTSLVFGQTIPDKNRFSIDETDFIETRWRYVYTFHAPSNTIIHKAEESYDYYIHFKYNKTYQEYYNGALSKDYWSLDGNQLNYKHNRNDYFRVIEVNRSTLILAFDQPNSNGRYQYHYVAVDADQTPFGKISL